MRNSDLISPFRFPGGKTWLVPTVLSWLNDREDRPHTFLEPFAGGASVGLSVARAKACEHVVLVERDDDVAAVWTVLLSATARDFDRLCTLVSTFVVTRESVEWLLDSDPVSAVDRAFVTIVRNRCQRGGVLAHGAGLMRRGENDNGLSSRWYADTLVRRFHSVAQLRDRVTFVHGDGLDQLSLRPYAAVFADPPYTAGSRVGARLYRHHDLDHEALFGLLALHRGPVVATYDDVPAVRDLAIKHGLHTERVGMRTTHHITKTELLLFGGSNTRKAQIA